MNVPSEYTILAIVSLFITTVSAQYKENDWNERDKWMNVAKIFEITNIKTGDVVADIGCHEGYLSIHLANTIGESGKVYAVDVRQDRLDRLDEHVKQRNLTNVETILGDYDNPKLPEGKLDAVIVMDTYHEMKDYRDILEHIKKSLKPNGKVVIIEKFKKHMLNKSRDEQVDEHTISSEYVTEELEKAGFSISTYVHDFGRWKNEADKRIWIVVGDVNKI
ncbi:methyltransferase domain-containing protein [Aquimarina sp. MMG016]|nr:methyltransferase domain-containing protein [Aquimarina sp. MMG016]